MPVAPLITAWRRTHRNLPGPFGGTEPLTVTYPTTPLAIKVRIALGADLSADPLTWAWQDITQWVRFDLGISLDTGRPENSGSVTTARGVLKLDNRDGRFSRRNPTGPYYGLLSKNTPIWVTVDAGPGEKTRMEMFVNEWPTRWSDKSATDSTVTIQCAGVLRRLQQGEVLKSALRRAITFQDPTCYWALEAGASATQADSMVGGAPLLAAGTVGFGTGTTPVGGDGSASFAEGGFLSANTGVASAAISTWELQLTVSLDSVPTVDSLWEWTVCTVDTPGSTVLSCGIGIFGNSASGPFYWAAMWQPNPLGYSMSVNTLHPIVFGQSYNIFMQVLQIGADWQSYAFVDEQLVAVIGGFVAGATVFTPTRVNLNKPFSVEQSSADNISISHVALWVPGHITLTGASLDTMAAADQGIARAATGNAGEMAHERIARLCDEEGVVFGPPSWGPSPAVGPQSASSLVSLLRDAEAAGGGVLYERRWGLAYQSLTERYNAPTGLALDFDQGHIAELPEPADDDQRTRNRWTVSRVAGSEYTAEQTTGPLGTGADGPGLYDDSAEVNVETDIQLPSQAGWRVHLGTIDEDRWSRLDLNFTRNPSLIDSWTALAYGARTTVANPPAQMPPDALDLVIEGYAERFDSKLWTATLNASPSSAYRAFTVASASGNLGRIDAANSTLAADATSGATTISVASPAALWRTGAVNFDIGVSGEQMTVTNISGASSPQTFTVTRSVNGVVKAQPAAIAGRSVKVSLWKPAVIAL